MNNPNAACQGEPKTIAEINDWLSESFAHGLSDSSDMLEHLSIVVEGLCLQGILSDGVFNGVYTKLHETMALLATLPNHQGWRVKVMCQNADSLFVEALLPDVFPSFEAAQIEAGNVSVARVVTGKLIVIMSDGREYYPSSRYVKVFAKRDRPDADMRNWPGDVSGRTESCDFVKAGDLQSVSERGGEFCVLDNSVVPFFVLHLDDKLSILFASGEGLRNLERRFATTQSEVVDGLIEASCLSTDPALAQYLGYHGLPEQRLAALRKVASALHAIQNGVIA